MPCPFPRAARLTATIIGPHDPMGWRWRLQDLPHQECPRLRTLPYTALPLVRHIWPQHDLNSALARQARNTTCQRRATTVRIIRMLLAPTQNLNNGIKIRKAPQMTRMDLIVSTPISLFLFGLISFFSLTRVVTSLAATPRAWTAPRRWKRLTNPAHHDSLINPPHLDSLRM